MSDMRPLWTDEELRTGELGNIPPSMAMSIRKLVSDLSDAGSRVAALRSELAEANAKLSAPICLECASACGETPGLTRCGRCGEEFDK